MSVLSENADKNMLALNTKKVLIPEKADKIMSVPAININFFMFGSFNSLQVTE